MAVCIAVSGSSVSLLGDFDIFCRFLVLAETKSDGKEDKSEQNVCVMPEERNSLPSLQYNWEKPRICCWTGIDEDANNLSVRFILRTLINLILCALEHDVLGEETRT